MPVIVVIGRLSLHFPLCTNAAATLWRCLPQRKCLYSLIYCTQLSDGWGFITRAPTVIISRTQLLGLEEMALKASFEAEKIASNLWWHGIRVNFLQTGFWTASLSRRPEPLITRPTRDLAFLTQFLSLKRRHGKERRTAAGRQTWGNARAHAQRNGSLIGPPWKRAYYCTYFTVGSLWRCCSSSSLSTLLKEQTAHSDISKITGKMPVVIVLQSYLKHICHFA